MTKVIEKLELLKKLAPYLKDRETLCFMYKNPNWEYTSALAPWNMSWEEDYKTLTLEEAIELIWKQMCQISLIYPNAWEWKLYSDNLWEEFEWETLMEAFSKFLEYLIDNNLLWNKH